MLGGSYILSPFSAVSRAEFGRRGGLASPARSPPYPFVAEEFRPRSNRSVPEMGIRTRDRFCVPGSMCRGLVNPNALVIPPLEGAGSRGRLPSGHPESGHEPFSGCWIRTLSIGYVLQIVRCSLHRVFVAVPRGGTPPLVPVVVTVSSLLLRVYLRGYDRRCRIDQECRSRVAGNFPNRSPAARFRWTPVRRTASRTASPGREPYPGSSYTQRTAARESSSG